MVTVNGCVEARQGRTYVREKDWILHQPRLGDHQAGPRRARGLRNPKARETGPRHTMSIAGYLRNRLSRLQVKTKRQSPGKSEEEFQKNPRPSALHVSIQHNLTGLFRLGHA